jgi:hypothetical protein
MSDGDEDPEVAPVPDEVAHAPDAQADAAGRPDAPALTNRRADAPGALLPNQSPETDRSALRASLASAPARLEAAGAALWDPSAPLASGAWSALDVARHLVAVELEVWQARLDSLASARAGEPPTWAWVEPDRWSGPGDDTFAGVVAAFARCRFATVRRLDRLNADGWARTGHHATFGVLDVAGLLRVAIDHDAEHLRQLRTPGRRGAE